VTKTQRERETNKTLTERKRNKDKHREKGRQTATWRKRETDKGINKHKVKERSDLIDYMNQTPLYKETGIVKER